MNKKVNGVSPLGNGEWGRMAENEGEDGTAKEKRAPVAG
jgi:hypothetical protein